MVSMAGNGEGPLETAMSKSGAELFREILRVMGDADVEDYYKAGIWKDEFMRLDLQLVYAHRKEGGAPEPTPLADIPTPEVPGGVQLGAPGSLARQLAARVAALKAGGGATAAAAASPAVTKPVEPNDGPDWLEVALKKNGAELFRELLRVMGDADEDDYTEGGAWLDDLLRLDLKLVVAHRKEGGTPSIPALKDVREPILPRSAESTIGAGVLQFGSPAGASVSPAGATLAARVAALKAAAVQGSVLAGPAPSFKPPIQIGSQPSPISISSIHTAAVSSTAVGATSAEDRLTTLFATKWKLEPARTKLILSQLSPPRRRYVIQKFQTTDVGSAAFEHLETFITECELTNAWAAAEALSASPKPAVTGRAVQIGAGVGVKRPLITAALNAAKRPCIISAAPPAAAAAPLNTIAQRLAAARAKIAADRASGG